MRFQRFPHLLHFITLPQRQILNPIAKLDIRQYFKFCSLYILLKTPELLIDAHIILTTLSLQIHNTCLNALYKRLTRLFMINHTLKILDPLISLTQFPLEDDIELFFSPRGVKDGLQLLEYYLAHFVLKIIPFQLFRLLELFFH